MELSAQPNGPAALSRVQKHRCPPDIGLGAPAKTFFIAWYKPPYLAEIK